MSAPVTESTGDMIAAAYDEAGRRDPQRVRQRVFLVDGNKQQITAIEAQARERGLKVPVLIDYIHVSGHIGKASAALHPGDPVAAGQWADGQLLRVLHGRAKAVAATLASVARKTRAHPRTRHLDLTDVDRAVTYLDNNRQHMHRLIQQYYSRDRHWHACEEALDHVLATLDTSELLADLSEASTRALLTLTGWQGTILRSSDLTARTSKSQRLSELTCAAGATTYLCGTGGARYLDHWPFALHGLHVVLYTSPAQGDPHIWEGASKLSALRALMAVGPAALSTDLHQHADWLNRQPTAADAALTPSAYIH